MPIDLHGFLGTDIENIRERIKEQYKPLIDLCYDLNTFSQQTKFVLRPNRHDGQRITATALLVKVLNDCQSVVLLVEHGLPLQAQTVLRSALEAFFNLALICKDPSFAQEYANRDLHD